MCYTKILSKSEQKNVEVTHIPNVLQCNMILSRKVLGKPENVNLLCLISNKKRLNFFSSLMQTGRLYNYYLTCFTACRSQVSRTPLQSIPKQVHLCVAKVFKKRFTSPNDHSSCYLYVFLIFFFILFISFILKSI